MSWLEEDARAVLGPLGRSAEVFNVYSVGDSGEGCEVIEFTTPTTQGPLPWTARVLLEGGERRALCTLGWSSDPGDDRTAQMR